MGLVLMVAVAGLAGYAAFVEPYWLDVTRHSIGARVNGPLRIAHLSDLHTRGFGQRERRLLEILASESPDVIVVTGDTHDGAVTAPARELLQRLRAPLGVWVVRGNWEHWAKTEDEPRLYESAGVRLLANQGVALRPDVWLLGLDDPLAGKPDIEAALAEAPPPAYKIALVHTPDFFPELAGRVHLALAGHGHGGQVRLPVVGPLWRPPGAKRFIAGWYAQNNSKMYVSRGLGTSIAPIRFLCRPEVAIIEIRPG